MAVTTKTPADLNALTRVASKLMHDAYQRGINDEQNWVEGMYMEESTTEDALLCIFYGALNQATESFGPGAIPYQTVFGSNIEFAKRQWKDGLRLRARDFFNEKYGMLKQQAMMLGTVYANIYHNQAAAILNNGTTAATTGPDGVPLYDNNHVHGLGTYDNLLAGTGNFAFDLKVAIQTMMKFPDDKGRPRYNNVPTHVIVPTSTFFDSRTVLNNTLDPADNKNTENPLKGFVKAFTEPLLIDANDWHAIRSAPGESPFIAVRDPNFDQNNLIAEQNVTTENFMSFEEFTWRIMADRALYNSWSHLFALTVNA